jgi:hypothetical protein
MNKNYNSKNSLTKMDLNRLSYSIGLTKSKIKQRRVTMNTHKKLSLWLVGAAATLAFASQAKATTPQSIDIHVSINATKNLSASATSYAYGALNVNVSSVSSSIVITNNSGGIIETYRLLGANATSDTGGTNWTLASSTSADNYKLEAEFSNAQPANTDATWSAINFLTTSAQDCTTSQFGNGTAGESGATVSPSATRNLWFRIHTPDSVTDPGAHTGQATISVK